MLNLEHLKLSDETVIMLVSNGLLKQAFCLILILCMKTQEAMCLNLVKQNLPGHRQSRTVAVETFVPSGTFSQFFPSLMGTF